MRLDLIANHLRFSPSSMGDEQNARAAQYSDLIENCLWCSPGLFPVSKGYERRAKRPGCPTFDCRSASMIDHWEAEPLFHRDVNVPGFGRLDSFVCGAG
jgi:hypothetical protein